MTPYLTSKGTDVSAIASIAIDPTLPPYNAAFDAAENGGASATATQFTISCPAFQAAWQVSTPIGKQVLLIGAGPSAGLFYSHVTGYDGSNTITVFNAIGTTVSGATLAVASDDTTALDAAFVAAATGARGATIQLPANRSTFYQGTGLSSFYPRIVCSAGEQASTVYLGPGTSLVTSPISGGIPAKVLGTYIRNLRTVGGFGMVRYTFTGVNSGTFKHLIDQVRVENFTGAGISSLATDDPYWTVNAYMSKLPALAPSNQICFVHTGLLDACDIHIDNFNNPITFKLGLGGCNGRISGSNVMVDAYAGTPRTAIWIVPAVVATNSGAGLVIEKFRFGNEGYNPADFKILYADENVGTGADFATRTPSFSASTGFITGHIMAQSCTSYGSGTSPAGPIVYSTTPNVRGCHWSGTLSGTRPSYIVQFLTPPGKDYTLATNVIGPFVNVDTTGSGDSSRASNANGFGYVIDPDGMFSRFPEEPLAWTGGSNRVGSVLCMTTTPSSVSGATTTPVTDALSGNDAQEVTFHNNTSDVFFGDWTVGSMTAGTPLWVEFDLKAGSSSSLTDVGVQIAHTDNTFVDKRQIIVPSTWTHHRYRIPVREIASNFRFRLQASKDVSGGKVQIGRVRIYQAREPLALDLQSAGNSLQVVDVTDPKYGAKGDGVTDDTSAVRAAYAAIVAVGGGTIWFPMTPSGGVYLLNTPTLSSGVSYVIPITNDNIRIEAATGVTYKTTINAATFFIVGSGKPSGPTNWAANRPPNTTAFNLTGTTSVGASSVTLATLGDAANFTAGDWIYIRTGQCTSVANNLQPDAEINQVTGVVGSALFLRWPASKAFAQEYFASGSLIGPTSTTVTAFPATYGVAKITDRIIKNITFRGGKFLHTGDGITGSGIIACPLFGAGAIFGLDIKLDPGSVIGGDLISVIEVRHARYDWGEVHFSSAVTSGGYSVRHVAANADTACTDIHMKGTASAEKGVVKFEVHEGASMVKTDVLAYNPVGDTSVHPTLDITGRQYGGDYDITVVNAPTLANAPITVGAGSPCLDTPTRIKARVMGNIPTGFGIYINSPGYTLVDERVPDGVSVVLGQSTFLENPQVAYTTRIVPAAIKFSDASPIILGTLPPYSDLVSVRVQVINAFNDATVNTIDIGTAGSPTSYVSGLNVSATGQLSPTLLISGWSNVARGPLQVRYNGTAATTGFAVLSLTWHRGMKL